MARHKLTDLACRKEPASDKVHYLNDGGGLRLLIRPDGAKYWILRYRFDGKESAHGLGAYPGVALTDARRLAEQAKAVVASGGHPTKERQLRKAKRTEASKATFGAIAGEWLAENKPGWSGHHHERNEGLLRRFLLPTLGDLPISSITERMLLDTLRSAYTQGVRVSARRARSVAGQIWDYAKATHRATNNPARELSRTPLLKAPEVKHFAALKREQVGPMLRALADSDAGNPVRAALLLMLFTGVRDAALRAARWQEFNLSTATWTIPGERMKSKREHRLPLPEQAVAVLRQLAAESDHAPSSFVFASTSKAGFLAENTLRVTLHRLGFKVTAHGIRSLLTDVLNVEGFNADAIERQLDHAHRDKVRAAYLRDDFMDQRRQMMQWFADWAEAQRNNQGSPALPDNVVNLRRVA